MKLKLGLFMTFFALVFMTGESVSHAQTAVSQSVTLEPGWNIVSTPMVLESHFFSAPETSTNFDIYLLDASKTTGWATMADLGQTEFEPLYGYFIKNKTGETQTLTFNYDTTLEPNEKLFERTFSKEGWYSIGVANASYAKTQSADREDTDNPSDILSLLSGKYDLVIDFTDETYLSNRKSVAVGNDWKAVVPSDINELNDLRDTKGYAVYVTNSGARYNGFQNNPVAEEYLGESLFFGLSDSNPEAATIVIDSDSRTYGVGVLAYEIEVVGGDVQLEQLWVNLETSGANVEDVVSDVYLIVNGSEYQGETTDTGVTSSNFVFDVDDVVMEGETTSVEVLVDLNSQDGNYVHYGETITAQVSGMLVANTVAYGLDGQLTEEQLFGVFAGETHSLVSEGIIIPSDSVVTETETQGDGYQVGVYTIEFEVTAIEGDYYIAGIADESSQNSDSGIGFYIDGADANVQYSSEVYFSGGEDNGVFLIHEGETETLMLTVYLDPDTTGQYRVTLDEVWYSANPDGVTGAELYVPIPASDFRTSYQSINAN